jgi:hypothetical protein
MLGRMFMIKLKIIIPLAVLASCNSYYFPLIAETPERIINSFKPYSPGENYIRNQEYSFVTVELGQQNATLVLGSIENNIFTWLGRDNVIFKTYKGFIISAVGLEHNFEIIDPIDSIEMILSNGKGNLSYNFDSPRLYDLKASTVDFNQSQNYVAINLVAGDINWDVEITIRYGSRGLPSEVIQSIHPFLNPAKLSFYYKY